ncbi:4566_t:CDS:1, partial [Funneliformis geosporum]
EFIADQISSVLEAVRPNRFSAIVSDNSANVKLARNKISLLYPHIFSIQCIAHAINLVTQDVMKFEFADRLIRHY